MIPKKMKKICRTAPSPNKKHQSRERGILELSWLINEIKKVKLLEEKSAQNHVRKLEQYNIKWEKTHRTIKIYSTKMVIY